MKFSMGMAYVDGFADSFYGSIKDTKCRLIYYYLGILSFSYYYETQHHVANQEIDEIRKYIDTLGNYDFKSYQWELIKHTKKQLEEKNMIQDLFIDHETYLKKAEVLAKSRNSETIKPIYILEVLVKENIDWIWPDYLEKINHPKLIQSKVNRLFILDLYDEDKKLNNRYKITANSTDVLIGRSEKAQIRFSNKHKQISTNHAVITCYDNKYYIKDFGSENGTYVNDILIGNKNQKSKFVELNHGDVIRLSTNVSIVVSILDINHVHEKTCILCQSKFMSDNDSEVCGMCYYEFEKDLMNERSIKEVIQIPRKFELIVNQQNQLVSIPMNQGKLEMIHVVTKKVTKNIEQPNDSKDIIPGYEMIQVIGEGGMGKVYLVKQKSTGAILALKTMKSDKPMSDVAKEKFKREAYIQEQMNHKYIAKHFGHGEYNGMLYILMEYYKHGTILNYMNEIKNSPNRYKIYKEILIQILQGLDYLHHASLKTKLANGEIVQVDGIVHRDIKPQNIFVDYDSKGNLMIKIADFGLSKSFITAGASGLSKTGYAMGTFTFMPRQQLIDSKYSKPEVDIWAAVASIYYLASGYYPKPFSKEKDAILTCAEDDPIPIRNRKWLFPSKFAKIIDQALYDNCENLYYQEASDLINDLLKIKV